MTHRDVVIATPGHSMKSAYVKSLMHTIKRLEEENISWSFTSEYSSFVSHAREATVLSNPRPMDNKDEFLEKPILQGITYNKIFWIDSDIAWTPDDFMKLYESQESIISGIYPADGSGNLCVFYKGDDGIPYWHNKRNFLGYIPSGQEVVETYTVGFGFLCVAAGVFESLERPYFNIDTIEMSGMPVSLGEDFSWCLKANKAGYKIMVDKTVQVAHYKEVGWTI